MSFKNKKGEVPWYVIGLILALLALVVSVFVFPKIREAQGQSLEPTRNTCVLAGGECKIEAACANELGGLGTCPLSAEGVQQICCEK